MTEASATEPQHRAASGPLDGVRVLDLSTVVMGPFATQTLGDLGADVITIETTVGDATRFMGPGSHSELSGVSMNLMRNKRSVVLDLKQGAGRTAFLRIAATADVMVTNLRPGAIARLRLRLRRRRGRATRHRVLPGRRIPIGLKIRRRPGVRRHHPIGEWSRRPLRTSEASRCCSRRWWPTRSAASPSREPSSPRCSTGNAPGRGSASRCR